MRRPWRVTATAALAALCLTASPVGAANSPQFVGDWSVGSNDQADWAMVLDSDDGRNMLNVEGGKTSIWSLTLDMACTPRAPLSTLVTVSGIAPQKLTAQCHGPAVPNGTRPTHWVAFDASASAALDAMVRDSHGGDGFPEIRFTVASTGGAVVQVTFSLRGAQAALAHLQQRVQAR